MFSHLLVPLDGSALAESALPVAVALGAESSTQVTLLHVLEESPPVQIHGASHLQEPGQAEAYLSEVERWLTERDVKATVHVHSPSTEVAKGITDHVRELQADLVVLCTHGGKRLRGFIFGRIAQQVLSNSSVPVLAVPTFPHPRSKSFSAKHVLVPLNGELTAEAALEHATDLVTDGGELTLVQVVPTVETTTGTSGAATRLAPKAAEALLEAEATEATKYLANVRARMKGPKLNVRALVARGDSAREILAIARESSVDLIAMATHGRRGVSAMWAGSVGARLVEQRDIPVLLIRMDRPSQG